VLVVTGAVAQAQQPAKVPQIGYLVGPSSASSARYEAFRQGLRELGYVEGKNIVIEWRSSEGNRDRQRALVAELVRLKVDVIVAVGGGDVRITKEATATIRRLGVRTFLSLLRPTSTRKARKIACPFYSFLITKRLFPWPSDPGWQDIRGIAPCA
jgi:putative ABC transport system substrate-binding protein